MKTLARHSSTLKPERLFNTLATEFDDPFRAYELFNSFLQCPSYNRSLMLKLLAVSQGNEGDSWEIRRLTILMLEHQVLKIPPENLQEFDVLLTQLRLKPDIGPPLKVSDTVLQEGFSAIDLSGFTFELRRKLERLERVHNQIRGSRTTKRALINFIALSRRECKLSLARYIFQPDEVVDRILRHVNTSRGLMDLDPAQPSSVEVEDKHALAQMPAYEARILEKLRQTYDVYWVSDSTGSELNALVEYPLTAVVIVIKPPGSDLEFEIKRAGRRGRYPLGVVHKRQGELVPPSHRLDGGSTQWLLRYESKSVSRLSGIYRSIHATEAPLPTFHSRSSIYNVQVNGTGENILDYFTEPEIFGREFGEMRVAMRAVIDSFNDEHESPLFDIPGDVGLTVQFLGHASPTQAIISGTSSFRLDRLAAYLSDDGAETYFTNGLKTGHSSLDDRRLADEVLDEVLCLYQPPAGKYRSYGQYVDDAFKVAANRAQADHNFSAAMQQMGKFWGTLLAVRASTNGESFVPRNVGLRSVWANGQWQIKVIFMDHDNLNLADATVENFQSLGAHAGTALDELYIWGIYDGVRYVVGAVDCLEIIYRAGKDLSQQGRELFCKAMANAYKRTHYELAINPKLKKFFHPSFVERIRDWDIIVRGYFENRGDPSRVEVWKEEMMKTFIPRGYDKNVVLEHVIAAERYEKFLERYAFLY
ncbi:MAG TPA: hypothetical protein VGW76_08065 [Pyrinomonadaceae bacterium]|nr:hypothetical protein [Pyrinomonadaceae bacterium]